MTGPLRILYLHQHYSAPAGSTATRAHAMAAGLAARGHDVTLACGRYDGAETGLEGRFRLGRRQGHQRIVVAMDHQGGGSFGQVTIVAHLTAGIPARLDRGQEDE